MHCLAQERGSGEFGFSRFFARCFSDPVSVRNQDASCVACPVYQGSFWVPENDDVPSNRLFMASRWSMCSWRVLSQLLTCETCPFRLTLADRCYKVPLGLCIIIIIMLIGRPSFVIWWLYLEFLSLVWCGMIRIFAHFIVWSTSLVALTPWHVHLGVEEVQCRDFRLQEGCLRPSPYFWAPKRETVTI